MKLIEDVSRRALSAEGGGHSMLELARELVSIAAAGLHDKRSCGTDEGKFLDPLREILEDGRSPAEHALARLKGEYGGDVKRLVEHWRIA